MFCQLIQMLLLEIMLLYYKEFVVPAKSLLELAKLFQVLGLDSLVSFVITTINSFGLL